MYSPTRTDAPGSSFVVLIASVWLHQPNSAVQAQVGGDPLLSTQFIQLKAPQKVAQIRSNALKSVRIPKYCMKFL